MQLKAQDILLDDETCEVYLGDKEIKFSCKEFSLLKMLLLKQGRVLSKSEIMNEWESEKEYDFKTNIETVYIYYLRKKLGHKKIETVRGFGFKIRLKQQDAKIRLVPKKNRKKNF